MAIDVQAVLAGLTIAAGIFLAGRTFGQFEERLRQTVETENEHKQQLTKLNDLLSDYLLRESTSKCLEEYDSRKSCED